MRRMLKVNLYMSLLLGLLAACAPGRAVPSAVWQPDPTGTSIRVAGSTQIPGPFPSPTPGFSLPLPLTAEVEIVPSPAAHSTLPLFPSPSPALEDPVLSLQTPVSIPMSLRQPWQFFSSDSVSNGRVLYRFRYPAGWYVYPLPEDGLVLQNFAGRPTSTGDLRDLRSGMIRVQMNTVFAETIGGFPAPILQPLAAGKPGTRRVLVDSALGGIIWDVRLYGISRESAVFQLTGVLRGSPKEIGAGVQILDDILASLDLYGTPDPSPTPVLPHPENLGDWEAFAGSLETDTGSFLLRFRFPTGWWVYPEGQRQIMVTNLLAEDPQKRGYVPGEIQMSVSASPCDLDLGCPKGLPVQGGGLQGQRQISQEANGDTQWLVYLYQQHTRFTFSARLSGPADEIDAGIKVLDRILWAIEIRKQ